LLGMGSGALAAEEPHVGARVDLVEEHEGGGGGVRREVGSGGGEYGLYVRLRCPAVDVEHVEGPGLGFLTLPSRGVDIDRGVRGGGGNCGPV